MFAIPYFWLISSNNIDVSYDVGNVDWKVEYMYNGDESDVTDFETFPRVSKTVE
jgi:hypothetical protein